MLGKLRCAMPKENQLGRAYVDMAVKNILSKMCCFRPEYLRCCLLFLDAISVSKVCEGGGSANVFCLFRKNYSNLCFHK